MESSEQERGVTQRRIEWSAANSQEWERAIRQGDRKRARDLYEDFGRLLRDEMCEEGGRPVLSDPATNQRLRKRLAQLGQPGARALDLGCGPTPVAAMALGELGLKTVGLDVAHSICTIAAGTAPGVRVVVGDAEQLPFSAGAFDVVTCDDTIEHVFGQQEAAAELGRVVRPGGRLLIVTPNASGLHVKLARMKDLLRGRRRPRHAYHITHSHVRELRWRELLRMFKPWFKPAWARPIGFGRQGTRLARTMDSVVRLPGMWRFGWTLFVELERRGQAGSTRDHYARLDEPHSQTSPDIVQRRLASWLESSKAVGRALDLGTGGGANLPSIARHQRAVGIDVSLSAASRAGQVAPVVVGDGAHLPFADGAFATVVCTEVLEHVDDRDAVLAEMARVLRPAGVAYITTPNYANLAGVHKLVSDARSGCHDWNPWGAHEGGFEAFVTGRRVWRSARRHFELLSASGLDYGQAITGRFAFIDRVAWSRWGRAFFRRLLPRLEGSKGVLGWWAMHTELVLRKRGATLQPGGR